MMQEMRIRLLQYASDLRSIYVPELGKKVFAASRPDIRIRQIKADVERCRNVILEPALVLGRVQVFLECRSYRAAQGRYIVVMHHVGQLLCNAEVADLYRRLLQEGGFCQRR